MGYLYLFTAVAFGVTKGYLGKKISNKTPTVRNSVVTSIIRMGFCILVGLLFVLYEGLTGGFGNLIPTGDVALLALGEGAATAVSVVCWLLAARCSAYMAIEAFLAMSVIVPISLSAILYGEPVSTSQMIGLVILLGSVIFMLVYSSQIKKNFGFKAVFYLAMTGISAGLMDFFMKAFNKVDATVGASSFSLYTYVFCAIVLFGMLFMFKKTEEDKLHGALPDKKKTLIIAIMAICLFCNTFFNTLASGLLDAVLIYPLSKGTSMILSVLMSTYLFKEKMKPALAAGIIMMFVGLVFINVIRF